MYALNVKKYFFILNRRRKLDCCKLWLVKLIVITKTTNRTGGFYTFIVCQMAIYAARIRSRKARVFA